MAKLTDFTDPQKLIAWLAHDGNPPTVEVETAESRLRWGKRWSYNSSSFAGAGKFDVKPVADAETLEIWWTEYRGKLATDWNKSPDNPYKPQTWKQFVAIR